MPSEAIAEPAELTYSTSTPSVNTNEDYIKGTSEDLVSAPINPDPLRKGEDYVIKRIIAVFPEAPIMIEVARCESGLDPLADRADLNVDVGLFQINQVHNERLAQLGLDRRDLTDNLKYARMLYDEQGLKPWYMSRHCWEKFNYGKNY